MHGGLNQIIFLFPFFLLFVLLWVLVYDSFSLYSLNFNLSSSSSSYGNIVWRHHHHHGFAFSKASLLYKDNSEIRLLMNAGICLIIFGG